MANYKITMVVDGARKDSVEKKLRSAFGDEAPMTTVEKIVTAESRADRLSQAQGAVEDGKSQVEELRDEMQEWYDSIPENLQEGSKAEEVQDAITALEELIDAIESLDFDSVSFPGMF